MHFQASTLHEKFNIITFLRQWQRPKNQDSPTEQWSLTGIRRICPSFRVRDAEVLTSCCKTNMLALGVMVRLASFSSTAVMSASPCAGSRRAQQLNKPLGDPDSREEMILPQDTVWQTHTHTHTYTCTHTLTHKQTHVHARTDTRAGWSQTSGFKNAHPQGFRHSLYTHTKAHIACCLGRLCSYVHGRGLLFRVQTPQYNTTAL